MVLATQNPIDMAGTHPLPEAQLDRFFVRLHVGYPTRDEELRILAAQAQSHPIDSLTPVISDTEILAAREAVKAIHINADVATYMVRISATTREHTDLRLGVSPRGTLALARGSQGMALLRGQSFVTPDIVKAMAGAILEHRLIVRPQAAAAGRTARDILKEILSQLPPPV
jgi:MoxR-like ATPase